MPSPVLNVLDFFDDILSQKENCRENSTVLVVYLLALAFFVFVWHEFSDKDFSFIMTMSGALQAIGFFLLLHKVRATRSAAGVSSKTLQMYSMVFTFRLSSTLVKNGYLPVDSTGDWLYQASDVASLLLVFQLLYYVHKRFRYTYQAELDSMPIWSMVPGVVVLGIFVHGHLNHSEIFDSIWAIGMYMDTIAMLPQLWMLVAKGGEVEALTANFVALLFFSRFLTWAFWYTGFPELAPPEGGFNKAGWIIMIAHSLQLLFSADFMYHYFKWTALNAATMCCGPCHRTGAEGPRMVLPVGVHDI